METKRHSEEKPMPTLSISVPDDVMKKLEDEADRRNTTKEQLAAQSVIEMLAKGRSENTELISEIIKENKELYRRLAG
jgi:predicted transcriptional regulator